MIGVMTAIDPRDLRPLHPAQSRRFTRELAGDMRRDGWQGRPLLVIETGDGDYQAWTGSHRIAAAVLAGLDAVPCYLLPEHSIASEGISATAGHCMDHERLAIIRRTGDEQAIALMAQEC